MLQIVVLRTVNFSSLLQGSGSFHTRTL